MKNPNKHIRIAFTNALLSTGIACWANLVPKDTHPVPKTYALITSQTKERTAIDKDGFEWSASIVVDITMVSEAGYCNPDIIDNMEEKVLNVVNDEMDIDGFIVKEMSLFDVRDIQSITNTLTITRRLMTYTMWLNNID